MAIQRLNIEQQLAEIGVRTTPARMNITQPRGQMRIQNEASQMEVDKQIPSFRVNRRRINNESGLKGPLALATEFRNNGRQAALRGIAQNRSDGDFLANKNIPGDQAVPMLARSKAMNRLGPKDINIGLMPQSPPEIEWDTGHMRINWSRHSVVIDWDGDYMARMTVDQRHSVEVFLRTEPYFRVLVEEVNVPGSPGRYIDHAI